MSLYQKIFASLFLVLLIGFSACNLLFMKDYIVADVLALEMPHSTEELETYISSLDDIVTEEIIGNHFWNECYGEIWSLLGKHEENGFTYVEDKDGILYSGNFWNTLDIESKEAAIRIKRLQEAVADDGTKVAVFIYPSKYNEAWSDGYYGIPYNDLNAYADELETWLRYYNIDYMDFGEMYIEQGKTAEEIFFKADHHWKIETAFSAFTDIVTFLNENLDADFDPDYFYRDLDNYEIETYENFYMGSQGRDAGESYAGLEDYTYIIPKFEVNYEHEYKNTDSEINRKSGTTLETLITKKFLEYEDPYTREMYNSYLGGMYVYDRIINTDNPGGANVLFLRDSYSSPLGVFFAPMCSEVDLVWTINNSGEAIENEIENSEYDYIFVSLVIDSVTDAGIPFYKTEEEEAE